MGCKNFHGGFRLLMSKKKKTKRKTLRRPKVSGPLALPSTEGKHFNLQVMFNKLNRRYFDNKLQDLRVGWGRSRKTLPKETFVIARMQEEDGTIFINRHIDRSFVPKWFLEYVLYHEMLHAVVPDTQINKNRRCVHTEEFKQREREFPKYKHCVKWENDNVNRFFRR